jgi:hypothetical protein
MAGVAGSPSTRGLGSVALIVAVGAAGFAYTAGWLSPRRITPTKLLDALALDPPSTRLPVQPRQRHLLNGRFRLERPGLRVVAGAGC